MKFRSLMLATAGALLLVSPAMAQQDRYNTNPTPAEQAATDRLNADAAARAQGNADADAANRDNYNANRAQFERDSNAANADRARYERDRARYDADRSGNGHRWDAFYGHDRFRDMLNVPARDLMGLDVNTRTGNRIGRIRDVDSSDHGRITRVRVEIGRHRSAWIDAVDLRFDPNQRTVLTDLTRDQVDGMANMHYPRF